MTAVCENHFTWAAGFGEEKTFVGFVTSSVHLQGGLQPKDKNFMVRNCFSSFSFWLLLTLCLQFWSELRSFPHCWQVTGKKLQLSFYFGVKMWFMKHECEEKQSHLQD